MSRKVLHAFRITAPRRAAFPCPSTLFAGLCQQFRKAAQRWLGSPCVTAVVRRTFTLLPICALIPRHLRGSSCSSTVGAGRKLSVICWRSQWAAITLIIVGTAEYVGAAAWIAVQRLAGNIIGGYLGYAGKGQDPPCQTARTIMCDHTGTCPHGRIVAALLLCSVGSAVVSTCSSPGSCNMRREALPTVG